MVNFIKKLLLLLSKILNPKFASYFAHRPFLQTDMPEGVCMCGRRVNRQHFVCKFGVYQSLHETMQNLPIFVVNIVLPVNAFPACVGIERHNLLFKKYESKTCDGFSAEWKTTRP